ncbi:ABC transporter [Enterovibrio norvegicus FF-454]|uniref:Transport permease protein n=1 Tax=Enterovibrio norvegicus FF-454 TaxID=1185651 RepID=A0A1E5C832_9GAMM|nr:ABC transporter permease [Enterovibrio norvegicus]OEE61352.1 ABC transporter [Enterovibrio norvegicus FF-454]
MATILKRNTFEVWRDVIFALFVREIRTGFNDKFGLSWAILNPLSFIFALSYMRSMMGGADVHTIPIFVFMFYGMLYIQLFLTTMEKTAASLKKNKALFAFRQVQPISAFLASALFEVIVKIVVVLIVFLLMYLMNIEIRIDKPLELLASFFLLSIIAISVGIVFAIIEGFVKEVGRVRMMLTRPLFFTSGVFFSLQDFSKEVWPYLSWNPILQAIELARGSAYSSFAYDGVSFSYLTTVTVSLLFIALSVYTVCWKKVISR